MPHTYSILVLGIDVKEKYEVGSLKYEVKSTNPPSFAEGELPAFAAEAAASAE
jgi:hypothetical protein